MPADETVLTMKSLALACCLVAAAGCSGKPGRVAPPRVDSDAAAATAIGEFDKNGDQQLDAAELVASPPLAHVLSKYDANGDGLLSQAELAAGIRGWAEASMGATLWPFQVTFNGRPLEGAEVKIIPAPFLGDAIQPASGVTAQGGRGALGIALDALPANAPKRPIVQPGLYRVEITHPTTAIPAKYNTATTLGLEVANDTFSPSGSIWALSN